MVTFDPYDSTRLLAPVFALIDLNLLSSDIIMSQVHHGIEAYSPPVRPQADRSSSQLEKATISHVEHHGKGTEALHDVALMTGERNEKVGNDAAM